MKINRQIINQRLDNLGLSLQVQAKENEGGTEIFLTPADLDSTNGFQIITSIGWRIISSKVVFGTYSLPLLQALHYANTGKKIVSAAFAKAAVKQGYSFSITINRVPSDIESFYNWPDEINELSLVISSKPFDVNEEDQTYNKIIFQEETILGIITSLLDIKDMNDKGNITECEFEKLPEGAKILVEVNRYERSRKNRIACINYYGCQCQVCLFDFYRTYGPIGRDFIHVHHVIPISNLGDNYLINPIIDLIPVCPNCHYMLHKKDPPYTIEELQEILISKSR